MNAVFSILILLSVAFSLCSGSGLNVLQSLISGANDAVAACVSMCGAYLVWMGLLNVMKEAGLVRALSRLLRPVLRLLFPGAGRAKESRRDVAYVGEFEVREAGEYAFMFDCGSRMTT